jgi:hypothetical protein
VTSARTSLWIGTYPAAGVGSPAGLGEGVWRVELDAASGTWGAAELEVGEFSRRHIDRSVAELAEERDAVQALGVI